VTQQGEAPVLSAPCALASTCLRSLYALLPLLALEAPVLYAASALASTCHALLHAMRSCMHMPSCMRSCMLLLRCKGCGSSGMQE